jgi:signal transduction histidine kinase
MSIQLLYGKLLFYFNFYAMSIFSICIIPLIAGVMGLKTDEKSFFTALFATLPTLALLYMLPYHPDKFTVWLVVIFVHTFTFFLAHYVQHSGFAIVKRSKNTLSEQLHAPSWSGLANISRTWLPTPTRLFEASRQKVQRYGSEPFLFSIVLCFNYMLPYITSVQEVLIFMAAIRAIGILLCCGLLLETAWPAALKPYFAPYWHFTLLYCLPFSTMLTFLQDPNTNMALISVLLAILMLIVLVDTVSFVYLLTLGTVFALAFHKLWIGNLYLNLDFDTKYNLFFGVGMALIYGLLFARRKELHSASQLRKTKLFGSSIAHETRDVLSMSLYAGRLINDAMQNKQIRPSAEAGMYTIPERLAKELMWVGPTMLKGGEQSESKVSLFIEAMKNNFIGAKSTLCSVKDCLEESLQDVYFAQKEVQKGLVLDLGSDFKALLPVASFKHVIYNLVKNAFDHGEATRVELSLDSAERTLCVRDNGRGIEAASLPFIFDLFYSTAHGSGIGLALAKAIVESFNGSIACFSKQGEGSYTEFVINFPEC